MFPKCGISTKSVQHTDFLRGMVVNLNDTIIKIETNIVMRGTVYEPEHMELSKNGPRPIVELLNPNLLDIKAIYKKEFKGMTTEDILLKDLLKTRDTLVSAIRNSLNDDEKTFLLSVKKGAPDWHLLGLENVEDLPAVKWKLQNIQKIDKAKHLKPILKLEKYLEQTKT